MQLGKSEHKTHLQTRHASAHFLGQMAHQIQLPPHGGEVLGVVRRSIARGSRRTAPTPGERVNGAVSRHATLGKRRVVSFTIATVSSKETSSTLVAPMRKVKPPSRVTVLAKTKRGCAGLAGRRQSCTHSSCGPKCPS